MDTDSRDIRHGIVNANVEKWRMSPPPFNDGTNDQALRVLRPLPFSGWGTTQGIAVNSGNVMRITPAPYSWTGPALYRIGASGSPSETSHVSALGTATSVAWHDKTPREAGFQATINDDSPMGQLSGGYVLAEVTLMENTYLELNAIGQNEHVGIGTYDGIITDNNVLLPLISNQILTMRTGALHPEQFPYYAINYEAEQTLGSMSLVKTPRTVNTSDNEVKVVYAYVPVLPTSARFMQMTDNSSNGLFLHVASVLLAGNNTGTGGGSTSLDVAFQPAWDNTITAGNNMTILRKRLAGANMRAALYAGMPVIELNVISGSAVVRVSGAMHYNIQSTRATHPLYDMADTHTPHQYTYLPMLTRVASHGGVGSTEEDAIADAKTQCLAAYGSDSVVAYVHSLIVSGRTTIPQTGSYLPINHNRNTRSFIEHMLQLSSKDEHQKPATRVE